MSRPIQKPKEIKNRLRWRKSAHHKLNVRWRPTPNTSTHPKSLKYIWVEPMNPIHHCESVKSKSKSKNNHARDEDEELKRGRGSRINLVYAHYATNSGRHENSQPVFPFKVCKASPHIITHIHDRSRQNPGRKESLNKIKVEEEPKCH